MFDSIYHMTLKILKTLYFSLENVNIFLSFMQHCNGRHNVSRKSGLSILLHGIISLPGGTSGDRHISFSMAIKYSILNDLQNGYVLIKLCVSSQIMERDGYKVDIKLNHKCVIT